MRAILLAAGYGTRLRPLTDKIPKCLVPIRGKPLLEIWLERLCEADVGPFLINTHYLFDQVQKYVEQSPYRENVKLVKEEQLLGTAGTLIQNGDFFEGKDGLLIHADNYCLQDFREFILAHQRRPNGCLMTMMTFRTEDPSSCGIVEVDKTGIVTSLHEKVKNPPGNLANGAVYILSAEAVRLIQKKWSKASDFSTEILNQVINKIFTYETKNFFLDIGSPEAYAIANGVFVG